MKLIQNTDDILIIDDKPWVAGLAIAGFGMVFAVLGVQKLLEGSTSGAIMILVSAAFFYGFYRFVERLQVVFNRPEGTVEFRKKSIQRYRKESYPLADIESADIDQKYARSNSQSRGSNKAPTIIYQISLLRKSGGEPILINNGHRSGKEYPRIHEAINNWLAVG